MTTVGAAGYKVLDVHGAANSDEAKIGPNNTANPWTTITAAAVDSNGKLVVDFKVTTDSAGKNLFTTPIPATSLRFAVAQLRLGDNKGDSDYWVSYLNKSVVRTTALDPETGKPFGTTATGYKMNQPQEETGNTGTLTTDCKGVYRYVTSVALSSGVDISANNTDVSILPNGGKYSYNAALTHRAGIEIRPASAGAVGSATMGANNATFDFVPDGKTTLKTREVVNTANCNNGCHKTLAVHGGPRMDVKLCVACHNPTNGDPESGNNLDLKVMAHKIHSAQYLPSVNFDKAGEFNSLYKNNPEGAVKGTAYEIWGFGNTVADYSEIAIPSNPANCKVCHSNAADADNYKTKPTKEACGSCHDGINWTDGTGKRMWFADSKITMALGFGGAEVTRADPAGFAAQINAGHKGAAVANAACILCHTTSGTQASPDATPVPTADVHGDFADSYPLGWSKAKTDFAIDMTLSAPANGSYYVVGEKPVVTIVLKDAVTGIAIDHTAISDASSIFGAGAATGNLYGLANADGTPRGLSAINGALNFYVNGPRALRKPALTTVAANKGFFSLVGDIGTSTLANNLLKRTAPANAALQDDVTATKLTGVLSRTDTGKLQYQLAIPAGTESGTYTALVLSTKKSTAGIVPKSQSLASKTFQVGQAAEEKRIAYGCQDCHATTVWHDNTANGAVGAHPAKFDPDQCAACHDYDAQVPASATGVYGATKALTNYAVSYDAAGKKVFTVKTFPAGSGQAYKIGANIQGFGAAPISRRVHGVHAGGTVRANGSPLLNYPFEVYNGENVAITFPQDVRNCEKCHTSATSGTWKTKPSRLACLSCHDSDAAYAHAVTQTVDPTPTILTAAPASGSPAATTKPTAGPYSGDEIEACPVCHASN